MVRPTRSSRSLLYVPIAAVLVLLVVLLLPSSVRPVGAASSPGDVTVPSPSAAPSHVPTADGSQPTLHGVARRPAALDVLVNKRVRLPAGYVPRDLVVPEIPFVFSGFDEKRQVRRPVARALVRMFAAAARAGRPLAGVSGYRSEATQRWLFGHYVEQRGLAAARRVSARPGHSEHQTGLAIDVTGADGRCPASACFAGSPAATWLAANAVRFGFVVRYTASGREDTGYDPEPWHLRYLGRPLARQVAAAGGVYEVYLRRPL